LVQPVIEALSARLKTTTLGNPQTEGVRMGPLASKEQVKDVKSKVKELMSVCEVAYGDMENFEVVGADKERGAFLASMLLYCSKPFDQTQPHEIEAFGPVSTVMPYRTLDEACQLAKMGRGSLCGSVFTNDDNIAKEIVMGSASMHGRLMLINTFSAGESTGHGSPLAHLVHGGPGRAGGGEEMGGIRGVFHYMQRTAIQGSPTTLTKITNVYQPKAQQKLDTVHPFRKHFEEIQVGDTLITGKHTVTLKNIEDFAELSGDKFYAHMDENSLEGTIFTERVAHGYYILSRAAGLFVDPPKGPVLLNYGIDECRFTKPVYPGATIGVRFTCKEKIDQEKRTPEDVAKGIVKWVVDVYDETGDTVAIATILTMVKKKNQN
jgi:oxepin-CoA hydrolase/3-oxo-5,6-dehydrosuberyl-CoA semialdehyde dehydrogenase